GTNGMNRTKERAAEGLEDESQDPTAGGTAEEVDDTDAEAAESVEAVEADHSESGELATIPFVGGDAFYEGGVATPGVKPVVAEPTTEDAVRLYLKSIGRVPLLTKDDEVRLAKRVEQNDMSAKNHLIEANLRLVVSIAKRYTGRGL